MAFNEDIEEMEMNNKHSNEWIVADICNTLYDSNTTFDFIKFCIATKKFTVKQRLIYKMILAKWSPLYWSLALLQKAVKIDYQKIIVASFFKNREVEEVDQWASSFYIQELKFRQIKYTNDLLDQFPEGRIILASSTFYPIAKVIAKEHGVQHFIASTLVISGTKYTGKLKDISGKKWQIIKAKFGNNVVLVLAISDNITDTGLLKLAKRKIAVCYNETQKELWLKIPGIEILSLKPGVDGKYA